MSDESKPGKEVSEAISAVRAGRLNEALRMLSRGELDQGQLEETLRIYHSELHIQNDELRQSQRRIEKSQRRFMRLFETQPTPLLVLDDKGVVQSANEAARQRFGLTDQQFAGRFFVRLVAPQDQTLFVEMLDALPLEGETGLEEMQLEAGGQTVTCMVGLARQQTLDQPMEEGGGARHEIIAHIVDISALKKKEQELQAKTDLLTNVSNEVPGALIQYRITNQGLEFDYLSEGIRNLFGLSPEQLQHNSDLLFEKVHPEDRSLLRLLVQQMGSSIDAWEGEYRVRPRPDGDWRWIKSRSHAGTSGNDSTDVTWYGYLEDVTDSRESTRMLIAQARRAAMGDMLGNITHQWKQPLNALTLSLSNLEDAAVHDDLSRELVDQHVHKSRQLIEQMTQTIRDFVSFFRPDKPSESFNPAEMAHQALDLLSTSLQRYGIRYSESYADTLPTVTGQPTELMQVVMILLQNAEEALRGRGITDPWIRLSAEHSEGRVILRIADNAGGVDEAVQIQMFEPYFSTKDEGSGIGLYLARLIMESTFNGRILCQSDTEGTEFSLELPVSRPGH